jgi:hypothetical protein
MKALVRRREVQAELLTNGNYLVIDNDVRCVYKPETFHSLFELADDVPALKQAAQSLVDYISSIDPFYRGATVAGDCDPEKD